MKKILMASTNAHKIKEISEMFEPFGIKVESIKDYDLPDVEETGVTFEENAILKAETISKLTNLPVLADDSGLEVEALNYEPGVYSARYASDHDDHANNEKLRENIKGHENRRAQFVSCIAYAEPNKETLVVRGTVDGLIQDEYQGENGFGYDPLFFIPSLGKTMAELMPAEKNKISHRANALQLMLKAMELI
jgi:XTP/dITP diphosphohydrolase